MSRSMQTYILNKLHLECEPYLITAALIGFNRANYLGPASLRGCVSVMDFICILNSSVWPVGTGSLRRHLSLCKHMDIGSRAHIYRLMLNDSTRAKCPYSPQDAHFIYEQLPPVSVVSLQCLSLSGGHVTGELTLDRNTIYNILKRVYIITNYRTCTHLYILMTIICPWFSCRGF